jgi:FemAB-related protein (PEP-CTERM system-associated)
MEPLRTAPEAADLARLAAAAADWTVRPLARADDAARDALVRAAPAGTFFHLAGWERAVERVFGHAPRTLGAFRGTELSGVLPLMSCRTPRFTTNLVSMPYAVYGGPASVAPGADAALVAAAARLAREERVGRLELRCVDDPGTPGFTGTDLYAAFVQDLPADPEEIWTRMPKRARAEVRKTIERHALVVSEGPWYADDLCQLFHNSKKKLGSPALPRAWYRALLEELAPHVWVHVARASARPLAATMSFVHGSKLDFYYIGVTDEANREYNATNFLVVRLQELCVRRGITRFDLGRSRVGSGPYQFKKNQGFEPRALDYRTLLVRDRALPDFNPSNPRTQGLRDRWSSLPDWLTRALSPRLMRYLP